MIGFYDYTVILTYCSVISAVVGILVSLSASPHPYIAIFLLMFSGLCDAFDGKVARHKKDRTKAMKEFGIQIDSLSDLAAFGVLPVCIGAALRRAGADAFQLPAFLTISVSCIYVLAAVIRLAYFNVTEEELQSTGKKKREFYSGLPVTSASLIFPTFVLIERLIPGNLNWIYSLVMALTAAAFVGKFRLRKPGTRTILILIGIGFAEVVLFLLTRRFF